MIGVIKQEEKKADEMREVSIKFGLSQKPPAPQLPVLKCRQVPPQPQA